MTRTEFPGVYIEEVSFGARPIDGVPTSTAGFVGLTRYESGPTLVAGFAEFLQTCQHDPESALSLAVRGFFENGGTRCVVTSITSPDRLRAALDQLGKEEIAMVCCPDEHRIAHASRLLAADCERRKDRICILQSPAPTAEPPAPPVRSTYAAYYHPWLEVERVERDGVARIPPGGHLCGVYARADAERVPPRASSPSVILGARGLSQAIDAATAEQLAAGGINVLRAVPGQGILVAGARTTSDDPEWRYVAIRRLLIFIEQSLQKGLQWAVFEPNGPSLWAGVRAAVETFLLGLWRSRRLVGTRPDDALFVRCDRSTMSQDDIDSGHVIVVVGVAPLRPAEFVVIRIRIGLGDPTARAAAGDRGRAAEA